MFKETCQKYFTPRVDLFVACLNHKVALYVSPVPEQHNWDIDALNINWLGLLILALSGSPSKGDPRNQAKQLPHHSNSPRLARDALVMGPSAALNRDPTPITSFNNTSQTVPQPCVTQQSTTS